MNFKEYSEKALETTLPSVEGNWIYGVLKLNGEAGEIAEKCGKIIRDNNCNITNTHKEDFKKELGDVLWYINHIANCLGIELEDVAKANIKKLQDRKNRNVLGGSGNAR